MIPEKNQSLHKDLLPASDRPSGEEFFFVKRVTAEQQNPLTLP